MWCETNQKTSCRVECWSIGLQPFYYFFPKESHATSVNANMLLICSHTNKYNYNKEAGGFWLIF